MKIKYFYWSETRSLTFYIIEEEKAEGQRGRTAPSSEGLSTHGSDPCGARLAIPGKNASPIQISRQNWLWSIQKVRSKWRVMPTHSPRSSWQVAASLWLPDQRGDLLPFLILMNVDELEFLISLSLLLWRNFYCRWVGHRRPETFSRVHWRVVHLAFFNIYLYFVCLQTIGAFSGFSRLHMFFFLQW